jgi:hypothetical protein
MDPFCQLSAGTLMYWYNIFNVILRYSAIRRDDIRRVGIRRVDIRRVGIRRVDIRQDDIRRVDIRRDDIRQVVRSPFGTPACQKHGPAQLMLTDSSWKALSAMQKFIL